MRSNPYYIMTKNTDKQHKFETKKTIVFEAQKYGIKPTARKWGLSKNSVRTWLKKFNDQGNQGLIDKRKGPHFIPHKTPIEIELQVLEARKQVDCYGPRRLQYFFFLPCSTGAISRILKQHRLTKKRKRKSQKKNDLREAKKAWKMGTFIQMDVKHLYDIPNYWGQRQTLNVDLPKYQYTMKDVKSGMVFLGYSNELSELNSRTMLTYFLDFLSKQSDFNMQELVIQTDNGVEFGGTTRYFERSPFAKLISSFGAKQNFIPPGMCNANADVESFHDTIEEEFFDLTLFSSRQDFMQKIESYRLFYNLHRPNYSKGAKTPMHIAQEDWPDSNFPYIISFFHILDLDNINTFLTKSNYHDGGQTIPDFPAVFQKS